MTQDRQTLSSQKFEGFETHSNLNTGTRQSEYQTGLLTTDSVKL